MIDTELNDDDETVLIFTLADAYELEQNGLYEGTTAASFMTIGSPVSENIYGETVTGSAVKTADDKIAPALLEDEDDDDYDQVYVDAATGTVITMTFGEDIDEDSVSLNTFEVGGGDYEVTTAEVINGNEIQLTVDNADEDDMVGVSVDQISGIRDSEGNVTTGISTEVTDEKL